jgi:hypothetical protein
VTRRVTPRHVKSRLPVACALISQPYLRVTLPASGPRTITTMAPVTGRRSRALDSDDNDDSRPNTPSSTAPNDSKRMRRPAPVQDEVDELSADADSVPVSLTFPQEHHLSSAIQSSVRSGRKYQPGAIVRVKLTNFVTYTSAEFFPGPNLNMVIGPNGTGKSTLVCAICLGLGWSPSVCTSSTRV